MSAQPAAAPAAGAPAAAPASAPFFVGAHAQASSSQQAQSSVAGGGAAAAAAPQEPSAHLWHSHHFDLSELMMLLTYLAAEPPEKTPWKVGSDAYHSSRSTAQELLELARAHTIQYDQVEQQIVDTAQRRQQQIYNAEEPAVKAGTAFPSLLSPVVPRQDTFLIRLLNGMMGARGMGQAVSRIHCGCPFTSAVIGPVLEQAGQTYWAVVDAALAALKMDELVQTTMQRIRASLDKVPREPAASARGDGSASDQS